MVAGGPLIERIAEEKIRFGSGWRNACPRSKRSSARMSLIAIDARIVVGAQGSMLEPGKGGTEYFKDFEFGPEMVVIPAGEFLMGSSQKDIDENNQIHLASFYKCEGPQHQVQFSNAFAVARFATTFREWDACICRDRSRYTFHQRFWMGPRETPRRRRLLD